MGNRIDLLISAEGGHAAVRRYHCDGKQRLDVRDLSTRAVIQIPAADVSVYRHTLMLAGVAYRILNIFKQA